MNFCVVFFFFSAEGGIRVGHVTGVQTCALPIFFVKIGPALWLPLCAWGLLDRKMRHDNLNGRSLIVSRGPGSVRSKDFSSTLFQRSDGIPFMNSSVNHTLVYFFTAASFCWRISAEGGVSAPVLSVPRVRGQSSE